MDHSMQLKSFSHPTRCLRSSYDIYSFAVGRIHVIASNTKSPYFEIFWTRSFLKATFIGSGGNNPLWALSDVKFRRQRHWYNYWPINDHFCICRVWCHDIPSPYVVHMIQELTDGRSYCRNLMVHSAKDMHSKTFSRRSRWYLLRACAQLKPLAFASKTVVSWLCAAHIPTHLHALQSSSPH